MNDTSDFAVGRQELRKYIVAVKNASSVWPLRFRLAIDRAIRLYSDGTHEMCQGREGSLIIQYLIPRKRPVPPRAFPVARVVGEAFA